MFDRIKNILKSELSDLFEKSEDTRTPFQRRKTTYRRKENEYDNFDDIDDAYDKAFNQKEEPVINQAEKIHYEALGLPLGTGFPLIKSKYKKLVKKHHPDRHQSDPDRHKIALERTRKLNMAYNYFKDKYEK